MFKESTFYVQLVNELTAAAGIKPECENQYTIHVLHTFSDRSIDGI